MANILTENSNPNSSNIDLMETSNIIKTINNEDKLVAKAVEKAIPEITKAVDTISSSFLNGGRLAYFGAGTSGRLGVLDASECWPTFSAPKGMVTGYIAGGDYALRNSIEGAEDSIEEALNHIKDFNPTSNDVVVGISASGNPKYVLTILEEAKKKKATTIGITSNPNAKLKEFSDVCIITPVGPEVVTGSSRLKSGTAQKMVLNMLSTASMIKIGKTYGNYMIDLQTSCTKLVDRAKRIIQEICNTDTNTAQEYLTKANNNVKIACVMIKKECTYEKALSLLEQNNGILRKVL